MTIHVNIGEAKTRLSELVAAAMRGEEVVVAKAGEPQVRLVPVTTAAAGAEAERRGKKRLAAVGMYAHLVGGREIVVRDLKMSEEEQEASYRRKFGAPD